MSLSTLSTFVTLYGNPLCLILGSIGNAFIVIMFNRQRENACAIYLTSSAVTNMAYLIYNCIDPIFAFYYHNSTEGTITYCKMNIFFINFIGQVAKTFLILACIDRFLITNNRANFRAYSTPKRAKYLIFFSFIFWSLLTIHAPIMYTVINGQCGTLGVYTVIYSVYLLTFVSLIPSIILSIFGCLTYRNMRQLQIRVQPVVQNTVNVNNGIQRKDRDLLIIVIVEAGTYVVTTALFPLIELEMMISKYVLPNKSFQYLQVEICIFIFAVFLLTVNSALPFYTYLISSKSFRRDFKKLIMDNYRKLTRQTPVVEIVSRTNRAQEQCETPV